METYLLYNNQPNPRLIEEIAAIVRDGGIIIYPTDSVYAIGCDALNSRAVERIYRYRGKEERNSSLSIICRDISQVNEYTRIDDRQYKILRHYLPGPYTFILQAGRKLPKVFTSRKTLGIRIPESPILHALLEELGTPLLTASLKYDNSEEEEYMTDPTLIREAFCHQADVLIDGGYGNNQPSTVVDLTEMPPVVIRQGIGDFND